MSKYTITIGEKTFHSKDLENKCKWEVRVEYFNCVRKAIYNGRTRASCCHCTQLITIDKATIEHIVPRSCGGELFLPTNLTIACASCNRKRGVQDFNSFRIKRTAQIRKYIKPEECFDRIETTNDFIMYRN